jgi:acyl carrier protein
MDLSVYAEVRKLAASLFQLSPEEITPVSSPENTERWDSVQHLSLVLALEQHFGLQFEPEELDGMENIGAITGLVATKLRSTG